MAMGSNRDCRIHQVKANLSGGELSRLEAIRKQYGFKSNYEVVRCSVLIVSSILCQGGLDEFKPFPEDIRSMIADAFVYEYEQLKSDKQSGSDSLFDKQHYDEAINPNTEYANQFVAKHYERLHKHYARYVEVPRFRDGYSKRDIFESMVERILCDRGRYKDYQEFERAWLYKFERIKEQRESTDALGWLSLAGFDPSELEGEQEDYLDDLDHYPKPRNPLQ